MLRSAFVLRLFRILVDFRMTGRALMAARFEELVREGRSAIVNCRGHFFGDERQASELRRAKRRQKTSCPNTLMNPWYVCNQVSDAESFRLDTQFWSYRQIAEIILGHLQNVVFVSISLMFLLDSLRMTLTAVILARRRDI